MAVIPRNTFRDVTQAEGPRPVFQTSQATPAQFGALEAAALSKAGSLRSQTGTASAKVAEQFGQSISDIGSKLIELAKKEKKEDDTNAAKRGLIELKQGITARTTGENGLFTFRGQTALNDVRPAIQDIDKLAVGIAERLPSDEARTLFLNSSGLHINTVTHEIGKFRINQRLKVDNDTSIATIKSVISAVANTAGVPETIHDGMTIVATETANISKAQGHSKETAAAFKMQEQTKILKSAVVSAVKQGRIDIAKDILAGNGGYKLPGDIAIDGVVRTELEKMVLSANNLGEAQQASDNAFAAHPGDAGKIFSQVRQIKDPQVRKEALTIARQRVNEEAAVQRKAVKDARLSAIQHVDTGGSFRDWRISNPELVTLLDARDLTAIDGLQTRRTQGKRNPSFSDRSKFAEFNKLRKDNPKEFLQLSDQEFHSYLSDRDARDMIRKRDALAMKLSSTQTDKQAEASVRRAVNDLVPLAPSGTLPNRRVVLNKEARRRRQLVTESVSEWVAEQKEALGKIPLEAEIRQRTARDYMDLSAVADPTNTGLFFNPLRGEEEFGDDFSEKFGFAIKLMSPQQKAVARVPIRFISAVEADRLRDDIEDAGGGFPSKDILEAYAGAVVMGDEKRKKALIAQSKREQ